MPSAASETLSYGPHDLQKIIVYHVQHDIQFKDPNRYWVMYGASISPAARRSIRETS